MNLRHSFLPSVHAFSDSHVYLAEREHVLILSNLHIEVDEMIKPVVILHSRRYVYFCEVKSINGQFATTPLKKDTKWNKKREKISVQIEIKR